jgi:hypothetical protein
VNPSKQQQMEADADRMIQELQTVDTEQTPVVGADADTQLVEQNTDQGAVSTESIASSEPDNTDELVRLRADLDKSEQRYRTLAGMIDKRNSENDSLRALVAQLTQSVEQLKTAQPQTPVAPLVSPADEEAFGSDLIDAMRRVARSELESVQGKLGADIERLHKQVDTVAEVTVQSAKDKFEDKLTFAVPDWREINLDDGFIAWLNEYGMLEALNTAYTNADLTRTAKYFTGYKKFTGTPVAPSVSAPAAKAEDFVAPGKSKATPQPREDSGKIWTPADVTKLYADQKSGKLTEGKFQALEADLFKAQSENRFTYG